MAFLLRVELPDVPGSLGGLATALGAAGADIEAIEIIEHRSDGMAIDDVLLEISSGVMPDNLVTACHKLDDVKVHWISRYTAGANLSMDLEAVEMFTDDPRHAVARLVDLVPTTFRTDWAIALRAGDPSPEVWHATPSAPELLTAELLEAARGWLDVSEAQELPEVAAWDSMVLAASPGVDRAGGRFVIVLGRHGGPKVLASELARLGHMVSLAASVQTP